MRIEEAAKRSADGDTSGIQPEGGQVADWYVKTDPSMTDLLYLVAFLLHEVNVQTQLRERDHER